MTQWTKQQAQVAQQIIATGKSMGMPDSVIQSALMAGMQESSLTNLSGGDRDSAGVFQMRPSMGWGSHSQVTDVTYASRKWFNTAKGVGGYSTMDPTHLAQAVERSAYPTAYAKWSGDAQTFLKNAGGVASQENATAGVAVGTGGISSSLSSMTSVSTWQRFLEFALGFLVIAAGAAIMLRKDIVKVAKVAAKV